MTIPFTLAQVEAFVCVYECGNLTRAASRLGKDRTTVSELLDYLELDLGYVLFDRSSRPFTLTPRGSQLYRQARLFLHEAQAFCHVAQQQLPARQAITLSYDIFTPQAVLVALATHLDQRGVQLNLRYQDRHAGEAAIAVGEADLGLYQAVNKPISEQFKWRAIGSVEMAVFASPTLFSPRPVNLMMLASCTQLIPHLSLDGALGQRLQIADRVQFVNDAALLIRLLEKGLGWAFLPVHAIAAGNNRLERIDTEMGKSGLVHPMVAIWQPGQTGHPTLNQVLDRLSELFSCA